MSWNLPKEPYEILFPPASLFSLTPFLEVCFSSWRGQLSTKAELIVVFIKIIAWFTCSVIIAVQVM